MAYDLNKAVSMYGLKQVAEMISKLSDEIENIKTSGGGGGLSTSDVQAMIDKAIGGIENGSY